MIINETDEVASKNSRDRPKEAGFLSVLRPAALIVILAGAVGALGLMLYAGRRNPSLLLVILFAIWVLSPFAALLLASKISKGWSVLTRTTLYTLMLVLTIGSLGIYGGVASGHLRAKTGFVFLTVPLASWLLITIVVPIAALISGRQSRRNDGA